MNSLIYRDLSHCTLNSSRQWMFFEHIKYISLLYIFHPHNLLFSAYTRITVPKRNTNVVGLNLL